MMSKKESNFIETEIILSSYPRSGNTWMRYIIANLLNPEKYWHLNNINDVVPDMYEVDLKKYKRPLIFKSHEPYDGKPCTAVYLYRDGRDVSISYYNLMKTAYGYAGSFESFLIEMLTGRLPGGFGSWQAHVAGWLFAESSCKIHYIRYEDLCSSPQQIIMKMFEFLGQTRSIEDIQNALSKSTFDIQQQHVQKYSKHYVNGFRGGVKGGPGKWREVYSQEMNDLFWSYAGRMMERLGYKYDE